MQPPESLDPFKKTLLSLREEQSGREMGLAEKRNRAHLFPPACPPLSDYLTLCQIDGTAQNPWVDRGSWTLAFYGVVGVWWWRSSISPPSLSLCPLNENSFGVNAVSPPLGLTP